MLRAAIIAMSLLVSLPLFGAEMRFKTMRLPPNVHDRSRALLPQ